MVDYNYHDTLQKAVQAFRLLDIDQNGLITSQEFEKVMDQSGICVTAEEIQEIIKKLDVDNSGSVDFKEFLNYIKGSSCTKMSKAALWAAFKARDEDGCGLISNQKVIEIFHDLGVEVSEDELNKFLRILDPADMGICNYQQFEDADLGVDWLF